MVIQKVFILFILLLLSIFEPAQETGEVNKDFNSSSENIDSLILQVSSSGWDFQALNTLDVHVTNSGDIESLKNILKEFNQGWEKDYLNSLLLKKEAKFSEMYDMLFGNLEKAPPYFPFYNRLIFAASAENRINFLETFLDKNELPMTISSYLRSLIFKDRSEFKTALTHARKTFSVDSTNFYVLFNLYEINRYLGDYDAAMNYVNRILKGEGRSSVELSEGYFAAGTLNFLSSKYSEAEKFYKTGLNIAKKNTLNLQIAKGYINTGITEDMKGNTDAARVYFKNASDIANNIKDISTEAHALSELGVSYSFTNELIDAKKNYLESYYLFKKLGEKNRLALLSENLGKIYLQMFDYKSALKYFEEGINFAGENKRAQVLNLTGIADVYANLSNYTKALLYYKEAESTASEINELSLKAEINLGLGVLNYNLNRNSSALKYFSTAGNFALESQDPYLSAFIHHKKGLIYTDIDSLQEAESEFLKAAEFSSEAGDIFTQSLVYIDLSRVYLLKGDAASSIASLEKGLKISEQNNFLYLTALGELARGEVYRKQNNFNGARDAFRKSLSIADNLNEINLKISANHLLAELFSEYNLSEAASSYFTTAINLIEDTSYPLFSDEDIQIAYFSGKRDVYDSYASFLISQRYYVNAFEIIDRSRSRSTIQHLNNLKLQEYLKDDDQLNLLYEYDWIITSGIYDKQKIDSISIVYANLKKELASRNNALNKYLNKNPITEIRYIQENLSDDENIISIYSTSDGTYIFVISSGSFSHHYIPIGGSKISELASKVSPYYDLNKQGSMYFNQHLFSFNAEAAYKFYEVLLKDIIDGIPAGEKIIFSPSPELSSFPFEFLIRSYDETESPYNYNNKDFLVLYFNISYTPSVNAFVEQKQNTLQNNKKVLMVGNPSINNKLEGYAERRGLLEETGGIPRNVGLLPLKYSAQEINDISGIINADKILMNNSATETNFKINAPFSRIIHLSTHSFLYEKQPVIFFSNSYDAENDGFLEAGEIVQLQLNSDLVVLSSCNSGLGRVDDSEGIIGMSKAFFETGTKSVIVSLWEVNDKYTSILMTLFYEKVKEGYNKSEALRLAKVDFIRDYSSNPYYWSAFVLSGDISKLQLKSNIHIQFYIAGLAIILLISLLASIIIRRKKTEVVQHAGM